MNRTLIEQFCDDIVHMSADRRFILGICGPPGAGKSTLAAALVTALNSRVPRSAVVVPMDGFHLDNEALSDIGLLELKGVPASFDARGYVELLRRLRNSITLNHRDIIYCPAFDRGVERSVQDAIAVNPEHQFIVTEGNYLLLDNAPWSEVAEFCDEIWYLEVGRAVLYERLLRRHIASGKSPHAAESKIRSTDFPNAELVINSRRRASRKFSLKDLPDLS